MEKKVELNWLLDFYGPLLTEHRATLLRLYCEEDLSLSELAEQTGITRQGVHDAIRKAGAQLEEYEKRLGLLQRYRQMEEAIGACRASLGRIVPAPGSERALEEARRAIGRIEWIDR